MLAESVARGGEEGAQPIGVAGSMRAGSDGRKGRGPANFAPSAEDDAAAGARHAPILLFGPGRHQHCEPTAQPQVHAYKS